MLSLNSKESFPGSFDRCFVARTCYYHMACFNNVFLKLTAMGCLVTRTSKLLFKIFFLLKVSFCLKRISGGSNILILFTRKLTRCRWEAIPYIINILYFYFWAPTSKVRGKLDLVLRGVGKAVGKALPCVNTLIAHFTFPCDY